MVYLPTGSSDLIWSSNASLRASSPGRPGGGVGKGRRTCNYVSGIWIPPPIPLLLPFDWAVRFLPISEKQNWARMSTNIEKHEPRVMASLLMSSPPISILHRLFWCGYSNSTDVVASSSSFSRPVARASRRACLQATQLHDLQPSCSWASPLCVLVL